MAVEIVEPYLILTEGDDDKRLLQALIRHIGLKNIQVEKIGGKTNLRDNLDALKITHLDEKVTSLGIVRDSNSCPDTAFQSITDALRNAGLPVPKEPMVLHGEKPRTIVMLWPGKNAPGELEDLLMKSVERDPAIPCVEEFFQCLEKQGVDEPKKISKAKVQTFLASRTRPLRHLGEAADAGYWPWDHDAFAEVKDFLFQLASEGSPA